jgi:hypothetical protein
MVRDQERSISPEGPLTWTRAWKTAFASAPMRSGPDMATCTAKPSSTGSQPNGKCWRHRRPSSPANQIRRRSHGPPDVRRPPERSRGPVDARVFRLPVTRNAPCIPRNGATSGGPRSPSSGPRGPQLALGSCAADDLRQARDSNIREFPSSWPRQTPTGRSGCRAGIGPASSSAEVFSRKWRGGRGNHRPKCITHFTLGLRLP